MSRAPGPTQTDLLSRLHPSRTPGSLGRNDAAEPYSGARIGDTPGPLGVNDHAASLVGGCRRMLVSHSVDKFLDSVCDWNHLPGPALAFASPAHFDMTTRAVLSDSEDLMMEDILPPKAMRGRIYAVLRLLPPDVVYTDITPEQYMEIGQAQHFMRYRGQTKIDAYRAGLSKIVGPLASAIRDFKGRKRPADVATVLAESVHALQDSFSPGHVERTRRGKKLVITDIFVWADQDKKKHEAADATWQHADGTLSSIGQECVAATRLLLTVFILKAINRDEDASRVRSDLLDQYFTEQLDKSAHPLSPILEEDAP